MIGDHEVVLNIVMLYFCMFPAVSFSSSLLSSAINSEALRSFLISLHEQYLVLPVAMQAPSHNENTKDSTQVNQGLDDDTATFLRMFKKRKFQFAFLQVVDMSDNEMSAKKVVKCKKCGKAHLTFMCGLTPEEQDVLFDARLINRRPAPRPLVQYSSREHLYQERK